MNHRPPTSQEGASPRKLVIPSLFVSSFAVQLPAILIGLLLVDVGLTFGYPVGVTGQIRTCAMVLSVIVALFMGILSVRFKHKPLLMMGLLFTCISALGCGFAPIFGIMLVCYSIAGLGAAVTSPMTFTLVGEHFPREKRPSAIGWVSAGAAISYAVGAPVIGSIAGFAGWRLAFLGYALPVSLMGLLLAAKGLPSVSSSHQSGTSMKDYLGGFKGVFSSRSADACLAGSALSGAAWMAILVYGPSFFRQQFLMATGLVSIIVVGAALCYTSGSLVAGRFVRRLGRKHLTVLAVLLTGIFAASYTNMPSFWASVAFFMLGCLFSGLRFAASTSLTLEQVPRFRGTMMSVNHAAVALGDALGSGIGGLALLLFSYEGMAISLGAMGIAAAIVFQLLAIDPTRTETHPHS